MCVVFVCLFYVVVVVLCVCVCVLFFLFFFLGGGVVVCVCGGGGGDSLEKYVKDSWKKYQNEKHTSVHVLFPSQKQKQNKINNADHVLQV